MRRDAGSQFDDDRSTVLRPKLSLSPAPDAFVLHVVEGADRGKTFRADGASPSRLLVGSSPSCDIRLADIEVSRRHAALEPAGRRLRITDLDSKNGTYVDGVAVLDAYLRGGEVVRMGATAFRVEHEDQATSLAPTPPMATQFGRLIGASNEMRRLYPLCERLAAADVPVVIEGETGTGKEVLAESLHEQGPRAGGPFVVFDCTAVPGNLLESELFGHERGAFTGAVASRKGVFEQASGGTLLIDEIGDLDLALQPKLLRAIERSEVRRVGGDRTIRVELRVLSATRRDLDHEVAAGRFRDDLFHRIAVARIELPPLRRRRGDVLVLARHFARSFGADDSALPGDLLLRWDEYDWPGNVRELRNAVARHLALGDLPLGEAAPPAEPDNVLAHVLSLDLPFVQGRRRVIEAFERQYVERVLAAHGGNVVRAAQASGIARRYFQIVKARTAR